MPIRDILVTLMVIGSLPFILKRPFIGVLVWAWLSYMNPHRLTWGFAYDMPFAQIVAVVLIISLIFSKEKKSIPIDGLLVVWLVFIAWMSLTTLFSLNQAGAFEYYNRVIKIQLLTFVTMVCMTNQRRIDLLIWVICISIGFFSIKGGIFTLLSAGKFRVYGPGGSFITENNALALATLITIPLMFYLRSSSINKWVKLGWTFGIGASCISVLGSQSRGAFLAILSLAGYFWFQTKGKIISGMAIIILGLLALNFMPQTWHNRMDTIKNYQEDPSAMGRINAWKYSLAVANKRLLGGGFNSYTRFNYAKYSNQYVEKAFVAHSIYFGVLGDHGWPGLFMFLTILFITWKNLRKITIVTKDVPALYNYNVLSRMLTLSLIAFMSGGAFLSLAYFDLPWHIISMAYLLKHQLAKQVISMGDNPAAVKDL